MGHFRLSSKQTSTTTDYSPAVSVLNRKALAANNILVGDDPAQIRFFEQQVGVLSQAVDRVTDDLLFGQAGRVLRVYAAHRIDLSPEMRHRTGIWSAKPIVAGSSAIAILVRFAATLLPGPDRKLPREVLDTVGDRLTKGGVHDVRGTLWEAVWMLSDEVVPRKPWPDPWEAPVLWMEPSAIPAKRLHVLFKRLVQWSSYRTKGPDAARTVGVPPDELQRLKGMHLDETRVYRTVAWLSRWRMGVVGDYPCAFLIAALWQ